MNEFYRKTPPIPIEQLSQSVVDFDLAIESLFYYQVHERPSRWRIMISTMRKWFDLVCLLRQEGLRHRGYDYPDWRQFANLDFSTPTRGILRTRLRWYDQFDFSHARALIDTNVPLLKQKNIISNMAHIRVGLESKKLQKDYLDLYILSLLYCKYHLITGSSEQHDTLLPIYNNLYSLLLIKFDLHPNIFRNKSFWPIHSTLFLFPQEVGKLDINTFKDETSWHVNALHIISNNLVNNDE